MSLNKAATSDSEVEKAPSEPDALSVFFRMAQISILRIAKKVFGLLKFQQVLTTRMMLIRRNIKSVNFDASKDLFTEQREKTTVYDGLFVFTIIGERSNKIFNISRSLSKDVFIESFPAFRNSTLKLLLI